MMNKQHTQHHDCPLSIGRAACLFGFRRLLRENQELLAKLEAAPERVVHFVVDLHSFQAHADEIEWVVSDNETSLLVEDSLVDRSAPMIPMVHMVATYAELRGEIQRIEGLFAQRTQKDNLAC